MFRHERRHAPRMSTREWAKLRQQARNLGPTESGQLPGFRCPASVVTVIVALPSRLLSGVAPDMADTSRRCYWEASGGMRSDVPGERLNSEI